METNTKRLIGLSIFTLVLVTFIIVWFISSPKQYIKGPQEQPMQNNTFISENLNISFELQEPVLVKDMHTSIVLEYDGREIIISRIASHFDTLDDYLDDLVERNQMDIKERKEITIDGSPAALIFTSSSDVDHPIYFVMKDEWVYSMYTIHPELFVELDRIANTFKYHSTK